MVALFGGRKLAEMAAATDAAVTRLLVAAVPAAALAAAFVAVPAAPALYLYFAGTGLRAALRLPQSRVIFCNSRNTKILETDEAFLAQPGR